MVKKYLEILEKFCLTPGISANESETGISKVILDELKKINAKAFEDEFGNIIAIFGSGKKKILIDAHLDEVGFVTSKSNGKEIALFPIGKIDPKKVNGSRAFVFSKNIEGKIVNDENDLLFFPDDLSRAKEIDAGELVSFERYFKKENNIVKATALDNRVGCAALLELIKNIELPKEISLIAIFSTEEEKDCSSVGIVANKYKPVFSIIIDAAYAKPIEIDVEKTSIPEIGRGCAIQYLGKGFIVSRSVIKNLEKLAEKNNIKFQPEIPLSDMGRTNFSKLGEYGIESVVINIPVKFQHTTKSEFCPNDAIEAIKLLKAVIENYKLFVN